MAELPTRWRGKAYRRAEEERNPAQRQDAEEANALKCNKEVLGFLLEAGESLPFTLSVRRSKGGIECTSVIRCCRGLRPSTLKQRVTDWRPLRRWLLAEGFDAFPTDPQQILDYLDVLWDSSAQRSAYKRLLSALAFFEAAG